MLAALDTNAYTALGRGNKNVLSLINKAEQIGLPQIVLGEIYFGIFNGAQARAYKDLLDKFLSSPRVEVLEVTDVTSRLYGEIATELRRTGRPIQQNDIWIAALCKQYGYTLVTADKDFESVTGLDILTF